MDLRLVSLSLLVALTMATAADAAGMAENPYVIEAFAFERLEYEIVNPPVSTVGDIVALVIDIDADQFSWFDGPWVDTNNSWKGQILNPTAWGQAMFTEVGLSQTFDLTWQQFLGGMAYPYDANQPAAGYWVGYSEVGGQPGTYAFDSPGLAVSPGERLDEFYAYGSMPCSTFYLAHIDDAGADTFDENGLPSVSGEAIPEPATLALVGLGALALVRRRR